MIKKIIVVLFVLAVAVALCSFGADDTATEPTQTMSTTGVTTTRPANTTTTEKLTRPTVTEPSVSMPDDDTAWANYIVDNDYNYIADRLTDDQQKNVKKMCVTVGCKVSFEDGCTNVTDARGNVICYSKSFDEESVLLKPDFGILTLSRRAENETTYVYKGVTIFDFISYINNIEVNGFYLSAISSTDYMKKEGIFTGNDEKGNSVIVKLSEGMAVIALTEVAE